MRAAVLHGKEDVRVERVPVPALRAGEVRIAIEAALTCGTDLKVFKRGYHARMIVPPAVFGHELAGVISEVTAQARDWCVGDRVAVANSAPCSDCRFCRGGQENLCDDLLFLNGAYAESIAVPSRLVEKNLLRLKPTTNFRAAALTEPLGCVVQGVEDCKLRAGQRVLVIGAKQVVDVTNGDDVVSAVKAAVSEPFDVVVEAVGKPETWEAAVKLVRKGGVVNFFGGCPADTSITLDTGLIHYSNLTLLGSFHHTPRTIRRALELIEDGVIRADDFVDGEVLLADLPELFKAMANGSRAVKTLVRVRM